MLRPPDNASGIVEMDLGKLWFWYQTYDPEDGLICDGRIIKYVDYPELTEFLNTVQQTGNPRRDIAIPDLRGAFLRGFGGKSGRFGELQDYAVERITGSVYFGVDGDSNIFRHSDLQEGALYYGTTKSRDFEDYLTISNNYSANRWHRLYFDSSKIVKSADETRPLNAAFSIVIGTGRLKKNLKSISRFISIFSSPLYIKEVRNYAKKTRVSWWRYIESCLRKTLFLCWN